MKRGFIFSFDSFLALSIFTLFTVLIYFFFIYSPPTTQQYYFSEDMLNVMSSVKINELDLTQYPKINNLVTSGKIIDTGATLLEQIITFKLNKDDNSARDICLDSIENLLPPAYNISLDLTQTNICNKIDSKTVNIISRSRTGVGKIGA